MNIKVNKYFLILGIFSIIIFVFGIIFSENNYEDRYINEIDNIFDKFNSIEYTFDLEIKNYLSNNNINKYSVKEIRDYYMSIENKVNVLLKELKGDIYSTKVNKDLLLPILSDIKLIVSDDFIENDMFSYDNEVLIKNLQSIINDTKLLSNKYSLFKFNLGIYM